MPFWIELSRRYEGLKRLREELIDAEMSDGLRVRESDVHERVRYVSIRSEIRSKTIATESEKW
jgi:hypothetical protein